MAAKKSRTSKKTSKSSGSSSDNVILMLDTSTVLTLQAAIDALSELATALIMGSDDPAVRGTRNGAKKAAKTGRAGKSAKKKTAPKSN